MTQAFNLSQLANNLDSSGRLDATDGLVNAVPVANGGTGASSIDAARSNLNAAKGGSMSAFSFVESGSNLYIQHNGITICTITSSGGLLIGSVAATGNITAYSGA